MLLISDETEKVLEELEATQKEFWNVARETGNFLNMLIKMNRVQNALEIGTSNGYSGIWLALGLRKTGGHLTTIEFYEKRQSMALDNFKRCGVEDIITSKVGDACTILEYLKDEELFDFVFIDASKPQYIDYFKLVKPHLKKGGIICADNVISHAKKVESYLNAVNSDKDFQTEILPLPAGLALSLRIN